MLSRGFTRSLSLDLDCLDDDGRRTGGPLHDDAVAGAVAEQRRGIRRHPTDRSVCRIGFVFSDDPQPNRCAAALVAADDGSAERYRALIAAGFRVDNFRAGDALVVIFCVALVAGRSRSVRRSPQRRQTAARHVVRFVADRTRRRTFGTVVVVLDETTAHGTMTAAPSSASPRTASRARDASCSENAVASATMRSAAATARKSRASARVEFVTLRIWRSPHSSES